LHQGYRSASFIYADKGFLADVFRLIRIVQKTEARLYAARWCLARSTSKAFASPRLMRAIKAISVSSMVTREAEGL